MHCGTSHDCKVEAPNPNDQQNGTKPTQLSRFTAARSSDSRDDQSPESDELTVYMPVKIYNGFFIVPPPSAITTQNWLFKKCTSTLKL